MWTMNVARCDHSPGRPAIGWYFHLPFCTTKCGYCDFYSLPTIPALTDGLTHALLAELSLRDPGRPVETIFVGGGTPTVLPAEALGTILRRIARRAGQVAEFTVEANPSSTDELKLDLLRGCGVNRVSFGAQSFDPAELAVLERIHDPRHIFESVAAARAAGFNNINLDLIYAIPGQTVESWRNTLRRAIDLGAEHLSCYALMYEPGTSLTRLRHQGRVIPSEENTEAEMFDCTIDILTAAGFEHYEISNFARPGRRCRANIIYWENREYLGIGPSAVSYLDGVRRRNVPDVRRYVEAMTSDETPTRTSSITTPPQGTSRSLLPSLQSDPCAAIIHEQEQLSPIERAGETAVQMLRLTDGVSYDRFRTITGHDAAALFADRAAEFARLGLLNADNRGFRLTRRGLLVANRVMQEFLADVPTRQSS
ncbi:MAG: coproporphyrinogen III oxidase [Planctomycetota bacterium]|nr:MAG: coproporphyrinogen III oxidase [Planctomycetota bacterium]